MILIFFIIFSLLQYFKMILRLQSSSAVLKNNQRNHGCWGQNLWRAMRSVALRTGTGGPGNLCGINGSGNRVRLLDRPLLANWWSFFSVKPWSFWVGFNKKTFSKVLVRLLWTQLGQSQKIKSNKNEVTIMSQTLRKASYIYYLT